MCRENIGLNEKLMLLFLCEFDRGMYWNIFFFYYSVLSDVKWKMKRCIIDIIIVVICVMYKLFIVLFLNVYF